MHLSGYDLVNWAIAFVLQLAFVVVLIARKRYLRFPVFTGLVIFELATTIVLLLIWRLVHHQTFHYYYRTQLWLGIVDEIIQLFVFYELASQVFCPTGRWAPDTRRAFLWLCGASLLMAVLLAALAAPPVKFSIDSFKLRTNLFSAALMSELFVGVLWLSTTAGLPWKAHVARIAQGMGLYAIVCLVMGTVNNYFGTAQTTAIYQAAVQIRGYLSMAIAGYWIVTLWQEAPQPRGLPDAMLMQIYTLQRRVEDDLVRIRSWRQG
jgi:hypothetical protein